MPTYEGSIEGDLPDVEFRLSTRLQEECADGDHSAVPGAGCGARPARRETSGAAGAAIGAVASPATAIVIEGFGSGCFRSSGKSCVSCWVFPAGPGYFTVTMSLPALTP